MLCSLNCVAQIQLGYLTGISKSGLQASMVQPVYGLTMQKQYNKYVNLESDIFYSQRMVGNKIQGDYLQFIAQAKFGYFGRVVGVYGGYGFSLNPAINHSNTENHTYVSFIPSVGGQLRIFPKTILELKMSYDTALTAAYLKDNYWYNYNGLLILGMLKFDIK